MSEWQPIETAPKDLTEILVYTENWGVCVAQWEHHAPTPFWSRDIHDFADLSDGTDYELEDIIVHPTHWMPLPKPPSSLNQAVPTQNAPNA